MNASGPQAIVVARRPLAWRRAEDAARAGIPHPRAASGLAPCGARLALVQDDACSLALVDPLSGLADAVALPMLHGRRHFDAADKPLKPDLECVVALRRDGRDTLFAFGSGSTAARERIAVLERTTRQDQDAWSARFIAAPDLYRALRDEAAFSGGALNLEGAVVVADQLYLFQRGNGGAFPALARVALGDLLAYLTGGPAPALAEVRRFDLGAIAGVPLGFTDAALSPDGELMWLASAEASPDTYQDGQVHGSCIGRLADGACARLRYPDGSWCGDKAEGLALERGRAWVAVDPDDPRRPAELLEVQLLAW